MQLYRMGLVLILYGISFAGNITNIQAPGNLESKYTLGCANIAEIQNFHTPADLYKSFASCIKEEDYDKAIYYYVVAGAYGYYDAHRVSDKTARQALIVLKMINLQNIEKEKKVKFVDNFKRHRESPKMVETCKFIYKLGKPNYFPRYMIQHGIRAFTNKNETDSLLKDYNSDEIWNNALVKYIKCKKE